MKKAIFIFLTFILLFTCAFADESGEDYIDYNYSLSDDYEALNLYAKVIKASEKETINDGYSEYIVQKVRVKILDKRFLDKEFDVIYYLEDGMNSRLPLYEQLKVGDKVYAYGLYENGELDVSAISYYDKTGWVLLLFIIFASLIAIIGGKNGIKALLVLIITISLIFGALIPGILSGKNIILITVLMCSFTIVVSFLIISGFNKKTIVAIIGTIGGIIAAAILGLIFGHFMRLTGINEEARMISVSISEESKMISFKDIMLSAIMISAMGACMDVGMSIASSLWELKSTKQDITRKEIIKSGMNIGKDVMGTMTNTLILAYVGSAMLTILLYSINGFDLTFVLNAEDITDEILKSMAGSIGLIATIPITAILSGILLGNNDLNSKKEVKQQEELDIPVNYFKG